MDSVLDRIEARSEIREDGCVVWTGAHNSAGYGHIRFEGRMQYVHRIVFTLLRAHADGAVIDHICGHRDCVNPRHLRAASNQANVAHRTTKNSNNTSGYPGAYWNKRDRSWSSAVSHRGKRLYLGTFATARDAYSAYVKWQRANNPYANEAHLNLP